MSLADDNKAVGDNPSRPLAQVDAGKILVGIPTLNEADHIAACIRSLAADPAIRQIRIVVADGGSTDRTREIVDELKNEISDLRLIDNPQRLQSAALNRIVAACAEPEHAVLVRCDAHSVYPRAYVSRVAESLLSRNAASLATAMDASGATCFGRAAAWIVDTRLGSGGSPHRGGGRSGYVDHGHHAGFRLDWFRQLGGYDPSFSHNEDAEYDHRLALAGGRVWLDAGIRMQYRMRDNLAALSLQYWRYGRGRARTVMKHRIRPRVRQLLPLVNLIALLACLALAPVEISFLVVPIAYFLLLAGMSLLLAVKWRSPCGLWAGPALGSIHLCWAAGFLWQIALGAIGR